MDIFTLKGRTAVVTGACGLLGRQHCAALAEAGAHVVAADIYLPETEELARSIGQGHLAISLDVTEKTSLESARDAILARFGSIDVLVNNAAVNDMFENPELSGHYSRFENYPLEAWKRSVDVNLTGVFMASQVFGLPMAEQGKGSIINIASTYGMVGPDQAIYREAGKEQAFYKSPAYPTTKGDL